MLKMKFAVVLQAGSGPWRYSFVANNVFTRFKKWRMKLVGLAGVGL
jgi:hypothetical protein